MFSINFEAKVTFLKIDFLLINIMRQLLRDREREKRDDGCFGGGKNATGGKANAKPPSFSLTVGRLGSGDQLRIVQEVAA